MSPPGCQGVFEVDDLTAGGGGFEGLVVGAGGCGDERVAAVRMVWVGAVQPDGVGFAGVRGEDPFRFRPVVGSDGGAVGEDELGGGGHSRSVGLPLKVAL